MLKTLWLLVGILAIALLLVMFWPNQKARSSGQDDPSTSRTDTVGSDPSSIPPSELPGSSPATSSAVNPTNAYVASKLAPAAIDRMGIKPLKIINMVEELGQAGPQDDLEVVRGMFQQFQRAFRENPVGENYEITAALLGANPKRIAYIPQDHPSINKQGELCDRWGNPYWFHSLSGTEMEVVSRGPDGKLHSADDLKVP